MISPYTEVDFYKKLVSYYRNQHGGRLCCRVEIRNVRGVGNYQSRVLRTFRKSIIPHYPGYEYHVILRQTRMFLSSAGRPGQTGTPLRKNLNSLER